MIAATLLALLAVPQDVPPDAPPGEEIVVSGRLLALKVSLKTNRKGRATACAIDRTSGDSAFDRTACTTTVQCFNQRPREQAAVSACVQDRMLAYARGGTTDPARKEPE